MATHKAKVVIHPNVWKKIEWFTHNFKTEIGALGKVKQKIEDGEKYFYVYDLLFPKQRVTGATVHFTPEMWGDLLREHGLNGLKDVAFYWHRHPGNSAHSGTDDEDTFETFMSKEAGRKFFIFLQTAVGTTGWNEEARIDLRLPVRHTITDSGIDLQIEESAEDIAFAKECEEIAEKAIVKPEPVVYNKNVVWNEGRQLTKYSKPNYNEGLWKRYEGSVQSDVGRTIDDDIRDGAYGNIESQNYMDNDLLNGVATSSEEKVSIRFNNGQATIKAGKLYGEILERVLTNKEDGKLTKFVRQWRKETPKNGLTQYNLQPVKKAFQDMKESLTRSYFVFNNGLVKKLIDEDNEALKTAINNIEKPIKSSKSFCEITNAEFASAILAELELETSVCWDSINQATVFDIDYQNQIGELYTTDNDDKLHIRGAPLVAIVKDIEYMLSDVRKDFKEEEEEEEEEECEIKEEILIWR